MQQLKVTYAGIVTWSIYSGRLAIGVRVALAKELKEKQANKPFPGKEVLESGKVYLDIGPEKLFLRLAKNPADISFIRLKYYPWNEVYFLTETKSYVLPIVDY
jgi:hypothetical protein